MMCHELHKRCVIAGRRSPRWLWPLLLCGVLLSGGGCASSAPKVEATPTAAPPVQEVGSPVERRRSKRLDELWHERRSGTAGGFPIGPGDVVEVAVPGLPEIEKHIARVTADGFVSIPLLGPVKAGGRTESELEIELVRKLEEIMYDPTVSVFVTEHHFRTVGVIGAVASPGMIGLTGPRDTVLDAIAQAGGFSDTAGTSVLLYPGGNPGRAAAVGSQAPRTKDSDFVRLALGGSFGDGADLYLPLRPGDVLVIPDRGSVLVKGWVHEPGSFEIAPGLTVLGAVVAAGGPRFAADSGEVMLIRGTDSGHGESRRFDLTDLEKGEAEDVRVISGDVIIVTGSAPKVAVSGLFQLVKDIFDVGFSAN